MNFHGESFMIFYPFLHFRIMQQNSEDENQNSIVIELEQAVARLNFRFIRLIPRFLHTYFL